MKINVTMDVTFPREIPGKEQVLTKYWMKLYRMHECFLKIGPLYVCSNIKRGEVDQMFCTVL